MPKKTTIVQKQKNESKKEFKKESKKNGQKRVQKYGHKEWSQKEWFHIHMHTSNHPTIHSPSSDPVINRVGSCSLIHAKEVMRVPGRLQFENLDNFFPDLNKSTGNKKKR